MGIARLAVWCVVLTACGRVGFDAVGDAKRDDATRDDSPSDASSTICPGLPATCGPAGTAPCCGSSLVPGGTIYRSFDYGTDNMWTDMAYPATVSDFRLDTYEVTVGRFRRFVDAGKGTQANPPPAGAGARTADPGGWDPAWNASLATDTASFVTSLNCDAQHQSWTDTPGANESLPMNCIDWLEAMAFCTWEGGFLPTEAEWEYAAGHGTEQRPYPWSNPATSLTIDCSYANYNNCVNPPNGAVNRVGSESPAGDGAWGQADLAGNVSEWTLDFVSGYPIPCDDCALLTGAVRSFHGGSFDSASPRSAGRGSNVQTFRNYQIGVRCARAAP